VDEKTREALLMYGPKPLGHWSSLDAPNASAKPYQHLVPGRTYVVAEQFTDYDGDNHAPGETWIYRGHATHAHADGVSLFVSVNVDDEWQIRLQWGPESQGEILADLTRYLRPAGRA
jgi:hypothetical protein